MMLMTDFGDWSDHIANVNVRIYRPRNVTHDQNSHQPIVNDQLSPAISHHYLDVTNISLTHFVIIDPIFILKTITA